MKKQITIDKLINEGYIKKSTKIWVDVSDLKKNNLIKDKLTLIKVKDLKSKGLLKKEVKKWWNLLI